MVSTLCVGFSGSNSTRLLKHGIAGNMVEIVALSWMAKPWGRSSRNLSVSQPPDLGAWPWEAHLRFQSLSILVGRQSARAISDAPLRPEEATRSRATGRGR